MKQKFAQVFSLLENINHSTCAQSEALEKRLNNAGDDMVAKKPKLDGLKEPFVGKERPPPGDTGYFCTYIVNGAECGHTNKTLQGWKYHFNTVHFVPETEEELDKIRPKCPHCDKRITVTNLKFHVKRCESKKYHQKNLPYKILSI